MITERYTELQDKKEVSLDTLSLRLDQIMSKERILGKPFVINISGASAAGKSTISNLLSSETSNCAVLNMDDYLKGWEIGPLNHDSGDSNKPYFARLNPGVYDLQKLHEDLIKLKEGKSIEKPTFDEITKKPNGTKIFGPPPTLILEGIYALESPFLELGDVPILIEASLHDRLIRKIVRNGINYKQNTNDIVRIYLTNDEPTYPYYQNELRSKARLIVNNPLDPTRDFDSFQGKNATKCRETANNMVPKSEYGMLHSEEQLGITRLGDGKNLLTYSVRDKLLINDVIDHEVYQLLTNYYEVK